MTSVTLGTLIYGFFIDYLAGQKGLRPTSIHSYRDAVRLFLSFVSADARRPISQVQIEDLTFERVLGFLQHLETTRHNHVATRNQRLAGLRTFFEYVGRRLPEMLHVCERVAAIPTKRTPLPETRFLDREEIVTLFARLPREGRQARRDHALLLMLYNTGARVQEIADLRLEHVSLTSPPHVRLHGKGDKWRTCPLWEETARVLRQWLDDRRVVDPHAPVFTSATGRPLTRFGIYKRVRQHAARLESDAPAPTRRITPHVFRHTAAVHLLEAGVEVNVIRGWLGHVSLETTNRYAEITVRMKEAAMKLCEPSTPAPNRRRPAWRDDAALLTWLASL
jgi:site-specific recombinase XerD